MPESNLRDTLTANGWRIDFLGPTTYWQHRRIHRGAWTDCRPGARLAQRLEAVRQTGERMATILPLIDGDRVFLPFTVVHTTRIG